MLVAHSVAHPAPSASYNSLLTGHAGVLLFFVISGFIMIAITGDQFDPKNFIKHRIVRIVPLYWGITILTALCAIVVPTAFKDTTISAWHLVASLLFIPARNPAALPGIAPVVKLGWTLNFEMFFYVVFAALFWLGTTGRSVLMSIFFIGLALAGDLLHPSNTLGQFYCAWELLAFVVGMWIGVAFRRLDLRQIPPVVALFIGLNAFCATTAYYLYDRSQDPFSMFRIALIVDASASTILLGLWIELRGVLPSWRTLHLFGDASYSMYLAHMFGVGAAAAVAHRLWGPIFTAGQTDAAITLCVIGGLVAGLVTYWFAERPLLQLFHPRKAAQRQAPVGTG